MAAKRRLEETGDEEKENPRKRLKVDAIKEKLKELENEYVDARRAMVRDLIDSERARRLAAVVKMHASAKKDPECYFLWNPNLDIPLLISESDLEQFEEDDSSSSSSSSDDERDDDLSEVDIQRIFGVKWPTAARALKYVYKHFIVIRTRAGYRSKRIGDAGLPFVHPSGKHSVEFFERDDLANRNPFESVSGFCARPAVWLQLKRDVHIE